MLSPAPARSGGPGFAVDVQTPATSLLAKHGLSLLITARGAASSTRVLLDAVFSDKGVPHNLDLLGVDLSELEAVVLSHGHVDHSGALGEVPQRVDPDVPVVAHPAAVASSR